MNKGKNKLSEKQNKNKCLTLTGNIFEPRKLFFWGIALAELHSPSREIDK